MSYKWLELWSYKNKWKALYILIMFNWFWKMKESEDHGGHSLERGKCFCHRVVFAPKWKVEWITGGPPVLGSCAIDTVFPPWGCTRHSHHGLSSMGREWGWRKTVAVEMCLWIGLQKLILSLLLLRNSYSNNGKHAKSISPEQYYWHCICKS